MGSGEGDGSVGAAVGVVDVDCPAVFVDVSVVVAAQEHGVGQVGGATVQPGDEVVGVGVGGGPVTAGPAAATVTDCEHPALLGGEQPAGAAEVDHDAVLVEQQRGQLRIAGDPRHAHGVQERRPAGVWGSNPGVSTPV